MMSHHGGWGLCGVGGPQVLEVPVPPQVLQRQAVHEAHQVHQSLPKLHAALGVRTLPAGVKDHQLQRRALLLAPLTKWCAIGL